MFHLPPAMPVWALTFPRIHSRGNSLALLTSHHIFVVSRPLAEGETEALDWAEAQDGATLRDIVPLPDGRDFIVLERQHSRQAQQDAMDEEAEHLLSIFRNEARVQVVYSNRTAT